ncbi:MAG: flagellar basal body rod protein FlgB [Rhodovulum sp.]|jgi:flagellar basal-body rod protein FlgB|nr:flagellar basal body rod protein FlgB [Rhodovulum sp.]MEC8628595.1 flagellar basal body rod protein FlgB [Pseudomonadota bacterium]
MTSIRDHLGVHASALQLREQRTEILASNIANAATPGFKARDLNFAAELEKAGGMGPMNTSHARHIPTGAGAGAGGLSYRVPTNPSLDGNTVELAVEQMEFSENALRYQTSLTLLNRKITGLMTAIKGE